MLRPGEILIGPHNAHLFVTDPVVGGERKARGLVPRNYSTHPLGCYACAPPLHEQPDFALIDQSEWSPLLKAKIAQKALLSDIRLTGNNGSIIPSLDQDGRGYCVPPGTHIRMADGTQKRIEDVRFGDEVLSAEGNIRAVRQLHARHYSGPMLTVKTYGHGHFRCTPNHSLLTRRGYVRADALTADDWVCVPRYAPKRSRVVQTAAHVTGVKRRLARVDGEERWETRMPEAGHGGVNRVPDFVELTPGVGRLFGLWLAEGHVDNSTRSVIWSFGTHEVDTLVAETVRLLRDEWGLEARVHFGPASDTVTQVEITGVLWCQLFASLCGKGVAGKCPHADLLAGPEDFLSALFWGWMDGDGCDKGRRDKAYSCGATVSRDLALAMYDVANAIGLTPSVNREPPQVNRHAKVRRPVWKVQVNPTPSDFRPNYRLRSEVTRVWRRVRKVEGEAYSGPVHNIGVEGDNSYVAEGLGVHNCWMHSGTGAVMMCRAKMNAPYVALSAYAGACVIKNYADVGGWGAEGMDFLARRGIPSEQFWPMRSVSRSNDKPETWANAALHMVVDQWADLQTPEYDRKLSFAQVATLLLTDVPVVGDFNFWSHSVCLLDLVEGASVFDAGQSRDDSGKLLAMREHAAVWEDDAVTAGFGVRLLNSWSDTWSDRGMGTLAGSKAVPDGSVAPRLIKASMA